MTFCDFFLHDSFVTLFTLPYEMFSYSYKKHLLFNIPLASFLDL